MVLPVVKVGLDRQHPFQDDGQTRLFRELPPRRFLD
jgi:hypothetical protein